MHVEVVNNGMLVHSCGNDSIWISSPLLCNNSKESTEVLHDPGPANRNWARSTNVLGNMEECMYGESAYLEMIYIVLIIVPVYVTLE